MAATVLVVLLLFVACTTWEAYPNTGASGPVIRQAQVACNQFVKQQLRNPESANFSTGIPSRVAFDISPLQYTVTGHVDTRTVGFIERLAFECTVEDGTWKLIDLDLTSLWKLPIKIGQLPGGDGSANPATGKAA